jgi:formate dehydrogenase maturation protein FdhE
MEYLIILYFVFLAAALWLLVASANRVNEIDIKAPRQANITATADKCPGCGSAIDAGAIKCGHCAALINFLR